MDNGNRWHTTEEVAPHLHLSIRAVHEHTRNGTIPHRKFGRRCLFDLTEIDAWLDGAELERVKSPSGRVVRVKAQ